MNTNLAYKEEPREEIIGGRIVMMATPTSNHNRIAGNVYTLFSNFLRGHSCEPFSDREGLYLEDDKEEYQPDMMVVCDPEKVSEKGVFGAPDLVVEVLSRSTAWYDRGHKKDIYEKHGVKEYWIIDPIRLSVEQYVLEGGRFILHGVYHKYLPEALADMSDKERLTVVDSFQCSLFDTLTVQLDDVFSRVR